MIRPFWLGVILSVLATAIAACLLLSYPSQRIPTTVSLTAGVPLTLFTTAIVYLLQTPAFGAEAKPGETKGKLPGQPPDVATTRWVHVLVRNLSTGFLGGGTAAGVRGIVRLNTPKGVRDFRTKWETRPNPLKVTPLGVANQIVYQVETDDYQMEAAGTETLEPGEAKSLDIAFKTREDPNCYISVPENFRWPNLKNPDTALPANDYEFELLIQYRGRLRSVGKFVLHNREGTEPGDLTLEKKR